MREAVGELNATVIVAVLVAMLSLFFFTIILPSIGQNEQYASKCGDAVCEVDHDFDGMVDCKYFHDEGSQTYKGKKYDALVCPWKG